MRRIFDIFHIFIFAISNIVFLYGLNYDQALFTDILVPIIIAICFSGLFLFCLKKVFNLGIGQTGIIISLFWVIFYSFGFLNKLTFEYILKLGWIPQSKYTLIFWIIIYCFLSYLTIKFKYIDTLNWILNRVSVIFFSISLGTIGVKVMKDMSLNNNIDNSINNDDTQSEQKGKIQHDIYYIILDAYPASSTLKNLYNYDNSDFDNYLKEKGFYIASGSRSNYAFSYLSLSSSLNMTYLDEFTEKFEEKSTNMSIPFRMIQNNRVMQFLKKNGYAFINFGSGWGPTHNNKYADKEYRYIFHTEFSQTLIENTLIYPIIMHYFDDNKRKRILYTFDMLAKIPEIKSPTFTFAHIVSPHQPFLFDRNGNPVPKERQNMTEFNDELRKQFLEQVIFLNKKVKTLIDLILTKSEIPPIIVLQSDHGPENMIFQVKPSEWQKEYIEERMNILNAYYLPDNKYTDFYDTISPVNSFRLIFNNYFGANKKLLSDDSFFSYFAYPYKFYKLDKNI